MANKVVLIYSGGLDSTTLLYKNRAEGYEVIPLVIDYGQRHRVEMAYAGSICEALDIHLEKADLRGITHLLGGNSQTDTSVAVPEGHYAEESMKLTVVPNRNMIMLSVAIAYALSIDAKLVSYGAHSGDHAIYPDCRTEFISVMDKAAQLCDWKKVHIHRDFIYMTKADIVKLGSTLEVPFKKTWSCYQGRQFHCGKCGSCTERREAFQLAGVADPTEYEA